MNQDTVPETLLWSDSRTVAGASGQACVERLPQACFQGPLHFQ